MGCEGWRGGGRIAKDGRLAGDKLSSCYIKTYVGMGCWCDRDGGVAVEGFFIHFIGIRGGEGRGWNCGESSCKSSQMTYLTIDLSTSTRIDPGVVSCGG